MISVVTAVRDLVRLREITAVLVRHGFGEIVTRAGFVRRKPQLHPKAVNQDGTNEAHKEIAAEMEGLNGGEPELSFPTLDLVDEDLEKGENEKSRVSTAERIRLVLQDLGPCFIKLGQIASTRPDIMPPDVISELKKLQDHVPSVPFSDIKIEIENSLGSSLDELFVSFDPRPLATASIGQVHRAVLETGEGEVAVAVKVQRPGVANTVQRDLELLHFMAAAIERAIPETKIYSPVGLVQQFDRSITSELNFMIEAENGDRFRQHFSLDKPIRFPKSYKQVSSKHVLTLEFFDGRKIDAALRQGLDGKIVAKMALSLVIQMIFEDGFFHADPHPGNIILLGDNVAPILGLIDLGMVGRLSPELRNKTVDLMLAAARKDAYAVADCLYAIGRPTKKVDMRQYRSEVSLLAERYIGKPLKEIELSAMIRDLVQGAVTFQLEIPPDFMLVGKALMTIEGIAKELDPELDIFGEARPHFLRILAKRYSPERLGSELLRGVEQLSRAGYDMPMQLREVLDDLRLGRLTVRSYHPEFSSVVGRFGKRIFAACVCSAMIFSGAYLLEKNRWILGNSFLVLAWFMWFIEFARDFLKKQ